MLTANDIANVSETDALALWIGLAFFATSYVIAAACLQIIAQKAGARNSWFAWVPFLNAYLMLRVAKRSGWWLLLFLIPGKTFVESILTVDMNVPRRPIAHMNPLAPDDIKNMEAAFRKWAKQLNAVAAKIP
jgi:hypothetical protein